MNGMFKMRPNSKRNRWIGKEWLIGKRLSD